MVNLKSVFLSLIGLFVLISCGTEPTPTYQLTTSVVGNGSVNPSSGQFDEGESVTITSTPDSGWVFSNWEGDWTSSQTPATITMDRDKTIIGVFERKEYPLNITIGEGEGSVSERVVSQPKVTDYPFETVVELTPVPANEWWVFSSWSGDITSDQQVVEVTVNGETNITLNFGFTGNSYTIRTYKYDSNNNLIEYNVYDIDSRIKYRFDYYYDSYNNLIDFKYYTFDLMGDSKLVQNEIYEYDLNNNRIQKLTKNNNGIITTYYSYDSDNKLIEESTYNRIITYNYDSLGNLIEEISVNPLNNQFVSRQSYEYDSSNNLIKNDVFGNDSLKIVTFIFQYDIYNNLIEYQEEYFFEYCLITNDCQHRVTYEYDSNNNRTREIYHTDGYVLLNEYNSENIIVKQTHYNSTNESEYFITFEYDSNDNLIEEVRYEYQKGKIVSNRKQTDPLNELCNQLNLPEKQMILIMCEE